MSGDFGDVLEVGSPVAFLVSDPKIREIARGAVVSVDEKQGVCQIKLAGGITRELPLDCLAFSFLQPLGEIGENIWIYRPHDNNEV
jgi:hypothetical protein